MPGTTPPSPLHLVERSGYSLFYLPSPFSGFLSDDFYLIELARSSTISEIFGTESYTYYRPLLLLSLKIEHALWGTWSTGYHLTNLAIHLTNVVLVYCISGQLMRDNRMAVVISGLAFGLTPTHATSVLWICGRTDLLCATFYFAAIQVFLMYVRNPSRLELLSLTALSALLALLTKEMAGSLPLVCLAAAMVFPQNLSLRSSLRCTWPLFAVLVIYLCVRWSLFGHFPSSPVHGNTSLSHLMVNIARYGVSLISPFDLEPLKPVFRSHPKVLIGLAVAICLATTILARRILLSRELVFPCLWVSLGLLPVVRLYAPWYLYIPSAGVAIAWGYAIHVFASSGVSRAVLRVVLVGLVVAHVGELLRTQHRTRAAGQVAAQVVRTLRNETEAGESVLILSLPSEARGIPIFGWTGNLQYGMALFGHPLNLSIASSIRLNSVSSGTLAGRQAGEIRLAAESNLDFFRLESMEIVTGTSQPRVGMEYPFRGGRARVTGLNDLFQPSELSVHLSGGENPPFDRIFVFSGGVLRPYQS